MLDGGDRFAAKTHSLSIKTTHRDTPYSTLYLQARDFSCKFRALGLQKKRQVKAHQAATRAPPLKRFDIEFHRNRLGLFLFGTCRGRIFLRLLLLFFHTWPTRARVSAPRAARA